MYSSSLWASSPTNHGDIFIEPLVNMEFTHVDKGEFIMGSPEDEKDRYDDEQQHLVAIHQALWVSRYEVTFDQYKIFTHQTKYSETNDNSWGRGKRPIINVNWYEANAFAEWLSKSTGHKYRLPTEAEWEYFARAGTNSAFSFGNNENDSPEYAWNGKNANGKTHPVGLKKTNPWGLYDIHGNVWEWTSSAYSEEYDGSEQKTDEFSDRLKKAVVRGGSWYFLSKGMRSADRRLYAPGFRQPYIGFRLVREE